MEIVPFAGNDDMMDLVTPASQIVQRSTAKVCNYSSMICMLILPQTNARVTVIDKDLPVPKRMKSAGVKPEPIEGNTMAVPASGYNNSHLPAGSLDRNVWRGQFIPTLINWAGGYMNPFVIPGDDMWAILRAIWKPVYHNTPAQSAAVTQAVYAVVSYFLVNSQTRSEQLVLV